MLRLGSFLRNPFSFFFAKTAVEERIAEYVIREHRAGRPLAEIVEDHYVVNRLGPRQIARVLVRQDVIQSVGRDVAESVQQTIG